MEQGFSMIDAPFYFFIYTFFWGETSYEDLAKKI